MALQKQIIPINFSKGVDTKSDPKQVVMGKLLALENGYFKTPGMLRKRPGSTRLAVNAELTSGNGIESFKDELVGLDGTSLKSYSADQDGFINKGSKLAMQLSVQSVVKNSYQQTYVDSCIASGLEVFVYEDSRGGIRYTIVDQITGVSYVNDTAISAAGIKPKIKTIGNFFVIFYVNTSDGKLKYRSISFATPSVLSSSTDVATDLNAINQNYDVCAFSDRLAIAYNQVSGSAGIALYTLSSTLVLSSQRKATSQTADIAIGIAADTTLNEIWVYFFGAAGIVKYLVWDYNLGGAAILAPTSIETISGVYLWAITGIADNGVGSAFYEIYPITNIGTGRAIGTVLRYSQLVYLRKASLTRLGVVSGVGDLVRSVGLASKPFQISGVTYLMAAYMSAEQSTYFLLNSSGVVVGKVAQDVGGGLLNRNMAPESNSLSSTVIQAPYLIKDLLSAVAGQVYTQTGINSAKFTFSAGLISQSLGNNLQISGGIVSMYDGANVVEHGYHVYPEGLSAGGLGGGALSSGGTYAYVACYEWTDNQGQIHRSAPSSGLNYTTTSSSQISGLSVTSGSNFIGAPLGSINLFLGMGVSGTGIPANSYITTLGDTGFDINNNATATNANETLTFSLNMSLTANTSAGSNFINCTPTVTFSFKTTPTNPASTSFYVDAVAIQSLRVGMGILDPNYTGAQNWSITAITGNLVTINSSYNISNQPLVAGNFISTVATVGQHTFTIAAADLPRLAVGMTVGVADADAFIITSIVGTTVTINSNFTTGSLSGVHVCFPGEAQLRKGQKFTNSNFTGTVTVTDVFYTFGASVAIVDQAATSTATATVLVVSNTIQNEVYVPTLRLTQKSDVRLVLYRTALNGTVYYRASSVSAPTINVPTQDYVYAIDSISDYELIGNDRLYTTGGVVENIAAPPSQRMTQFKNRIILIPDEDNTTWWFSKQVIPGSPVEFSDSFVKNIDQRDGGILAVGVMDEKIIFFKDHSIFCVVGDGPASTGANDDFIDAQRITTDCGSPYQKSIVTIPNGLMFKSDKGFYLLDRSLAASYIGADVEAYNSQTVTSAILLSTQNQVRFTMSSGTVLVYDYFMGQWSVYTGFSAVDATLYQGEFTYIKANGKVYQENPALFTDDGSFIQLKVQTGWLSLAGLQGYQRMYQFLVLGDYKSAHTLNVDLAYDFSPSISQSVAIPVLSDPGVYEFRVFTDVQKCTAMQVTLYDTQSAPFGEGLDLSALTLQVGIKTGLNKLNAVNSYG